MHSVFAHNFVAIIHVVLPLLVLVVLLLVPQPSKLVNLNFGVFFCFWAESLCYRALYYTFICVFYTLEGSILTL